MWLDAAMSNNPEYIATYFVECVWTVGGKIDTTTLIIMINVDLIGCPKILRTDPGTENSIVAVVQPALRHSGNDSFAGSVIAMANLQATK